MNRPNGIIALNQNGELVVVEWSETCVSTLSSGGDRLWSFTVEQIAGDRMVNLCSVALDGEGNIFVLDSQNHWVHKVSANGQFIAKFGTKGSSTLEFRHPDYVAYNEHNGKLYIIDRYHRVQILNTDLTFAGSFGSMGMGRGELYTPCGVACDGTTGNVYVLESTNHRVQVFTKDGKPLKNVW